MKKVISFLLCIAICLCIVPVSTHASTTRNTSFEESLASDLKAMGLFKGVSDTNFALGREPSRTEALVMLIRVLGKENDALNGNWTHPFTDVAPWADKYVGYAYENGLTNGISPTLFGTGNASASMYLTFILRSLGYSDKSNADFSWDNPFSLATTVGILPKSVNLTAFWRADVVLVSYAALSANLKGTEQTLAQKLIGAGVFTQQIYDSRYDAYKIGKHDGTIVELSAEDVYAKCSPAVFYIEVLNKKGESMGTGSGFFIDKEGIAVTNYHVIEGAHSAKVILPGAEDKYDVLGVFDYSKEEDWAVLQIDGENFSCLEIEKKAVVVGGATVYAIGSPLGLQNTITQGIISNTNRVLDGVSHIQTNAAVSPGSSGGALINKYGKVIGVTTASFVDGQNLNLAIPMSYINDYSIMEFTSLETLFTAEVPDDPTQPGDSDNQETAFNLLRDWIIENQNITIEGSPTIQFAFRDAEFSETYGLTYDEGSTIILVNYSLTSLYTGEMMISFIALTPSGQTNDVMYLFKNHILDTIYSFVANSVISAPTFNEDAYFAFDEYEGNPTDIEDYQDYCQYMILESLYFVDYVFSEEMELTEHSAADFGFVSYTD